MACCFGCASSSRPRVTEQETTTSTCTAEAVRRRHVFVIEGYSSLLNLVGANHSVRSDAFEAGGFHWAVRFYPAGDSKARTGCVSAYIELVTRGAQVRASCVLSLVPSPSSTCCVRQSRLPSWRTGPVLFRDTDDGFAWGWASLAERKKVEAPAYIRDDCLSIECVVTVFKQPWILGTRRLAPPRNNVVWRRDKMSDYFAKLLPQRRRGRR